ncbi:hypothetical protein SAMN05216466_107139 [Paraburkholderia phenazinium]|uniref:Uncharacterized protein n=1 Tax=Paraburkholderia phenazinium TaxID=60549 RepID=A0A1G7ZR14_9BURK|nr:hypothetical protein [Paraburkholderia phenazinium]SDH11129.1 hypothetical protein SAMN05216466_107139 [Paraburkholderia phenazinium]
MSELKQMQSGDEVFDIRGRAASYVALTLDGHVVQPIYTRGDEGDEYYGAPEVWREVFSTPPVEKLHGEIAAMQSRLATERASLDAVRKTRGDEDREYAARAAERKRFTQLQTLDDFIAGKITHFFVVEGYAERMSIQTFEQFMKPKDNDGFSYDRKMRLLSLFGGSNGDLAWYVDRYSDGSGGSSGRCFPAISYEDALAHAAQWINGRVAEIRKQEKKYQALDLANSAEKLGLAVPDDIAGWAKGFADERHQASLKEARKQFDAAKAKLQELEAS